MNVSELAGDIIEALTSGLTGIITAVPQAIQTAFLSLFMNASVNAETGAVTYSGLSSFAVVMLVFGGIALAFGITYLVYNLVRSKIG